MFSLEAGDERGCGLAERGQRGEGAAATKGKRIQKYFQTSQPESRDGISKRGVLFDCPHVL